MVQITNFVTLILAAAAIAWTPVVAQPLPSPFRPGSTPASAATSSTSKHQATPAKASKPKVTPLNQVDHGKGWTLPSALYNEYKGYHPI